jgi:hypothetical protein
MRGVPVTDVLIVRPRELRPSGAPRRDATTDDFRTAAFGLVFIARAVHHFDVPANRDLARRACCGEGQERLARRFARAILNR